VDALAGLDLEIPGGQIFGLFGPNASGKTTAIRILHGIARPDCGEVEVAGVDVGADPVAARSVSAAMIENPPQFAGMRLNEYLRFHARMGGVPKKQESRRVYEAISEVGLDEEAFRLVGELSLGQRQRAELARLILSDARVLFLDEPFSNIDIDARRAMKDRLRRWLGPDRCALYTSHYILESEGLVDRFAFIRGGRIIAQGRRDELARKYLVPRFRLTTLDQPRAMTVLEKLPGVEDADLDNGELVLRLKGEETDGVLVALIKAGIQVQEMRRLGTVEEIFDNVMRQGPDGGEDNGGG
jgi:ABC-2 type transport system ATP-binding protein